MTPEQIKERARRAEQALEFVGGELTAMRKNIYKALEDDVSPDGAYKSAIVLSALSEIETRLIKAVKEPEHQKELSKQ